MINLDEYKIHRKTTLIYFGKNKMDTPKISNEFVDNSFFLDLLVPISNDFYICIHDYSKNIVKKDKVNFNKIVLN